MSDEHYVRLMLWSRDRAGNIQAVVSHETAFHAYELSDVMPARIHLTVPKDFRKQTPSGVQLYRQDLLEFDLTERDGYQLSGLYSARPVSRTLLKWSRKGARRRRGASYTRVGSWVALDTGNRPKTVNQAVEGEPYRCPACKQSVTVENYGSGSVFLHADGTACSSERAWVLASVYAAYWQWS